MIGILREAGADAAGFARVLEFGCAAGRMLRFFPTGPGGAERWGVDVKAQAIEWCQRNLSPPMSFLATTTFPHLPFEDNSFDLVYAGSVFTHIADLPDAWFLELRRLLRPGGYSYITIHDKHALDLILTKHGNLPSMQWYADLLRRFDDETRVLASDYACFAFEGGKWGGFPVPQVFHDVEHLTRRWGAFARLVSVHEEAYGYQTALLFQKAQS
jgi:SAM-dependent methyltransferase